MLVVMNTNATELDIERVIRCIESKGFEARVCHGETKSVVHAIGIQETDKRDLQLLNGVFEVLKICFVQSPTKFRFLHISNERLDRNLKCVEGRILQCRLYKYCCFLKKIYTFYHSVIALYKFCGKIAI